MESALIDELRHLASSPIEWLCEGRFEDPVYFLDWLWFETYSLHQADRESGWIRWCDEPLDARDVATLDEVRASISNFRARRPRAAQQYVQTTRRLWALRAATPYQHPKHYPPADATVPQLLRYSAGGVSMLNPGLGPAEILYAFWSVLVGLTFPVGHASLGNQEHLLLHWSNLRERLFGPGRARFVMDTSKPIGATRGAFSTCLCFELDAATPILHAYPVDEQEAATIRGGLPVVLVNDFNGFVNGNQRTHEQSPLGKPRGGAA